MIQKLKALCIIRKGNFILATINLNDKIKERYYRIPGGTIEFKEFSKNAVRREINEELGCDIKNINLMNVHENIFVENSKSHHEIDFIYTADFVDPSRYDNKEFIFEEPYGSFRAEWISLNGIKDKTIAIYPDINYDY